MSLGHGIDLVLIIYVLFITDRISMGGNAIASVHQSVSTVSLEPSDLWLRHVCGSLPWLAGNLNWRSQVKVIKDS